MDSISEELQSQNQLSADTKLQGSSDSKIALTIDKEDSPSTVPVSVSPTRTLSTHTNDVLGALLEEWKSAKERMLLVKDRVDNFQEKSFLLLTSSVENESKKLFQTLDNLKRLDRLFNEIGESVSKRSIDVMVDALSLGTKAIQQSRQKFKQFVFLGSCRDQLVKYIVGVCFALFIVFNMILWMWTSAGSVFIILGMVVTIGFFVWVLKPVKLPSSVKREGKELLETMRLIEVSLVSILAILRCLPIKL